MKWTLLVSLALLTSARVAQAAPANDPAAAEVLFDRARSLAARGSWAEACPTFEQSQKLDPATGTLLNLAECRVHLGKVATAWQDFVEALRELPPGDARRDYTEARVRELAKRLPQLVVRLRPGAPSGTEIMKNGVAVEPATLGVAIPVDPGPVVVVASLAGLRAQSFTAEISEGQTTTLEVAPAPSETANDGAPSRPLPLRTTGWILGGAGVGGLTLGVVTGALALGDASKYRSACGPARACADPAQLGSANGDASNARTMAGISTVGFVVGAALVGVGAYFVLSHPNEGRPPPSGETTTSVGFVGVPGGGATFCRVTF